MPSEDSKLDSAAVEPRPIPKVVLESSEEFTLPGWGCVVLFVGIYMLLGAGAVAIAVLKKREPTEFMSVVMGVAVILAAVIFFGIPIAKDSKRLEEKRLAVKRMNLAEASETTNLAKNLFSKALDVLSSLSRLLADCDSILLKAREEHAQNAYSPFWDLVESTAETLNDFRLRVEEIGQLNHRYNQTLGGRRHNFPPFPVQLTQIPSPGPQLRELREVVRLGQTNFQFANIWEHRRTREVLIKGFRNLGEVIDQLGDRVAASVEDVGGKLYGSLSGMADDDGRRKQAASEHARRQEELLADIRDSLRR